MEVSAKLNYIRIAPRKLRLLADLVRGKKAQEAETVLSFLPNKSAGIILKLLKQALANARNNFKIDENNFKILKITIDGGPILKRFRPRARGSAYEIQKKTSHITLILTEVEKGKKTEVVDKAETIVPAESSEAPKEERTAKKQDKEKVKFEKQTGRGKQEGVKQKVFRRQTF